MRRKGLVSRGIKRSQEVIVMINRLTCCIGSILCRLLKNRSALWYDTFRHSLRSGSWDITGAYALARMVQDELKGKEATYVK